MLEKGEIIPFCTESRLFYDPVNSAKPEIILGRDFQVVGTGIDEFLRYLFALPDLTLYCSCPLRRYY